MNRQYQQGDRFEKRVMRALQLDGYHVWQSRGSKTVVDLLALKLGQVLLIQVKAGQRGLTGDEWNSLLALAEQTGAIALVADRDRRAIRYRRIVNKHLPSSRDWPCEPWSTDTPFANRGA